MDRMARGLQSGNQRRTPRVEVLLRVKGELIPVGYPLRILNLNRTGFAVLSEVRFRCGDRLHIRLTGPGVPAVEVAAAAVHTQPLRDTPGVYMTGFTFQPARRGGVVPDADIGHLLAAVAPAGFKV
jgi:hypothetical protein